MQTSQCLATHLYDLYDDREGCLLDAFEVALARITAKVAPAFSGKAPIGRTLCWSERVRAGLAALLDCFDEEPALAWLCLVEALKGGPPVLERRRAASYALAVAIDEGRLEAKSADPPPLTAESLVGGAASVIHARLVQGRPTGTGEIGASRAGGSRWAGPSLVVELLNPLTSMIVLPYLGSVAARKELDRPLPNSRRAMVGAKGHGRASGADPFRGLPIRITFRTMRVLSAIGGRPDASNREIGYNAGVADQGQMSKLLARLERAGLIENHGEGQARGEANAWRLTVRGQGVLHVVGGEGA